MLVLELDNGFSIVVKDKLNFAIEKTYITDKGNELTKTLGYYGTLDDALHRYVSKFAFTDDSVSVKNANEILDKLDSIHKTVSNFRLKVVELKKHEEYIDYED